MGLSPLYKLLLAATFMLAILAILQRSFQAKPPVQDALRLKVRYDGMLETIEIVAARLVKEHPQDDDVTLTRRIRDQLMANKLHNVDNFEGTIITVVQRLRGNKDEPGAIQKWTD